VGTASARIVGQDGRLYAHATATCLVPRVPAARTVQREQAHTVTSAQVRPSLTRGAAQLEELSVAMWTWLPWTTSEGPR